MIATATVSSTANGHLDAADVGSRDGLHAALALVDAEGWDGLTGRSVLGYARVHVVRPVVRAVGFTGADLNFAKATGWGIAWKTLSGRGCAQRRPPGGSRGTAGEPLRNRHLVRLAHSSPTS